MWETNLQTTWSWTYFKVVPPCNPYSFTFFLKSHDVYGSDYAATAKSAPTNAIASSKVIVDNSTAFIVR